MQKIYLYILIFLIAANNSVVYQIFKIPVLVEHFAEHHQQKPAISAIDFLAMHYWGQDQNDDDEARDMQLPLKKFDFHSPSLLYIPVPRHYIPVVIHATPDLKVPFYRADRHNNPALSALFRPPSA